MNYLLGIDGGGTKTLALLADPSGNILSRGLGGPSNYNAVGFEAACAAIETAISQALSSVLSVDIRFSALSVDNSVVNSVSALCLGLAGAGRPEDRDKFHAWAAELFPQSKVQVVSDAEILAAIASLGKAGIFAEPAGATSYAGLVKAVQKGLIGAEDPVLVLNTGSGLKDVKAAMQAVVEAPVIEPTLDAVKKVLK